MLIVPPLAPRIILWVLVKVALLWSVPPFKVRYPAPRLLLLLTRSVPPLIVVLPV